MFAMINLGPILVSMAVLAFAETHRMDLKTALNRAMQQSPDVVLTRYDEVNAQQAVQVLGPGEGGVEAKGIEAGRELVGPEGRHPGAEALRPVGTA